MLGDPDGRLYAEPKDRAIDIDVRNHGMAITLRSHHVNP
jgi:hypothetical protein